MDRILRHEDTRERALAAQRCAQEVGTTMQTGVAIVPPYIEGTAVSIPSDINATMADISDGLLALAEVAERRAAEMLKHQLDRENPLEAPQGQGALADNMAYDERQSLEAKRVAGDEPSSTLTAPLNLKLPGDPEAEPEPVRHGTLPRDEMAGVVLNLQGTKDNLVERDPDVRLRAPSPPRIIRNRVDHGMNKRPSGREARRQECLMNRCLSAAGLAAYIAISSGGEPSLTMSQTLYARGVAPEKIEQMLDFSRGYELELCTPGIPPDAFELEPIPLKWKYAYMVLQGVCQHNAERLGITISSGGWVWIQELKTKLSSLEDISDRDIEVMAATDPDRRFDLCYISDPILEPTCGRGHQDGRGQNGGADD